MKSGKVLRLSPNEEVAVLQKQQDERRKARLIQVREQDRGLARRVRQGVHGKRELEKCILESHLQAALASDHQRELRELEARYLAKTGELGQAHRAAQNTMQEEQRLQDLRVLLEAEQKWRSEARQKTAMKELNANQLRQKEHAVQSVENRKKARVMENERAHKVANKPPPPSQPLIMEFVVNKGQRVQLKEADGYRCSYYHIPHTVVHRDTSPFDSPHRMAKERSEADEKLSKHSAAVRLEQDEKARMRHRHALSKVRLEKDKVEVMSQLKVMEREDRTHRQKSLAKMPNNLFQPVHQRLEMAYEQQRDMEQAFEKLLVKNNGADRTTSKETSAVKFEEEEDADVTGGTQAADFGASPHKTVHFTAPETEHPHISPTKKRALDISSSLSPEDISPTSIPRPYPVSPPSHPFTPWEHGIRDSYDSTSLTVTPNPYSVTMSTNMQSRDNTATAGDFSAANSPSKSTQTRTPHFHPPKVLTRVLSEPDLSVSDTTSLPSTKGGKGSKGGVGAPQVTSDPATVSGSSIPPKSPKQNVSSEAMWKLISLVKVQRDAWREKQEAIAGNKAPSQHNMRGLAGDKPPSQHSMGGLAGDKPPSQHSMGGLAGDKPPSQHSMGGLAGDKPPSHHSIGGLAGDKPPSQHSMGDLAGDKPPSQHSMGGLAGDKPPSQHSMGGLAGDKPPSQHSMGGLTGDKPPSQHSMGGLAGDKPPSQHLAWDKPPLHHSIGGLAGDKPPSQHSMGGLARDKPPSQHSMGDLAGDKPPSQHSMGGLVWDKPPSQHSMSSLNGNEVPSQDGQERRTEEDTGTQLGSLSISTLSTRDSTPSLNEDGTFLPPFSRSRSVTYSPPPLSISQYHTTLETSMLSPTHPSLPNQSPPTYLTDPATPPPNQFLTHLAALTAGTGPGSIHSQSPQPVWPQEASKVGQPMRSDDDVQVDSKSHDRLSSQFPGASQQLNFHRARVDYMAMGRDLSMSTVTATDYCLPPGMNSDDLTSLTRLPTQHTGDTKQLSSESLDSTQITESSDHDHDQSTVSTASNHGILQSAVEGSAEHLVPPSLDIASSLTGTNSLTGSVLAISQNQVLPQEGSSSHQSASQRHEFNRAEVDYSALDTCRDLSMSTTTAMDLSVHADMHTFTGDTSGLQGLHSQVGVDEPTDVGTGRVPTLYSVVQGGSAGHLAPPSLDVTSSSVTADTQLVCDPQENEAVHPSAHKFQEHGQQASTQDSSSLARTNSGPISHPLHSFQRSNASGWAVTKELVDGGNKTNVPIQHKSVDIHPQSGPREGRHERALESCNDSKEVSWAFDDGRKKTLSLIGDGDETALVHAMTRSEPLKTNQLKFKFALKPHPSHVITPQSHSSSPSPELHLSHPATSTATTTTIATTKFNVSSLEVYSFRSSSEPRPQAYPLANVSPHSPQFLPLTEASYQAASPASPSTYTPLKPIASSPLTSFTSAPLAQTNLPEGVSFCDTAQTQAIPHLPTAQSPAGNHHLISPISRQVEDPEKQARPPSPESPQMWSTFPQPEDHTHTSQHLPLHKTQSASVWQPLSPGVQHIPPFSKSYQTLGNSVFAESATTEQLPAQQQTPRKTICTPSFELVGSHVTGPKKSSLLAPPTYEPLGGEEFVAGASGSWQAQELPLSARSPTQYGGDSKMEVVHTHTNSRESCDSELDDTLTSDVDHDGSTLPSVIATPCLPGGRGSESDSYSSDGSSVAPLESDCSDVPVPTQKHAIQQLDLKDREQLGVPGKLTGKKSPVQLQSHMKSALSLQEAFLNKKLEFVRHSQDRLKNIKANAQRKERAIRSAGKREGGLRGGPLGVVQDLAVAKSPKSPVKGSVPPQIRKPVSLILPSAKEREKIKKKEMRERNQRFYNRLPEVKLRKEGARRSREYEENRKRAKEYQQRIQLKMKSAQPESHTRVQTIPNKPKLEVKLPFK